MNQPRRVVASLRIPAPIKVSGNGYRIARSGPAQIELALTLLKHLVGAYGPYDIDRRQIRPGQGCIHVDIVALTDDEQTRFDAHKFEAYVDVLRKETAESIRRRDPPEQLAEVAETIAKQSGADAEKLETFLKASSTYRRVQLSVNDRPAHDVQPMHLSNQANTIDVDVASITQHGMVRTSNGTYITSRIPESVRAGVTVRITGIRPARDEAIQTADAVTPTDERTGDLFDSAADPKDDGQ